MLQIVAGKQIQFREIEGSYVTTNQDTDKTELENKAHGNNWNRNRPETAPETKPETGLETGPEEKSKTELSKNFSWLHIGFRALIQITLYWILFMMIIFCLFRMAKLHNDVTYEGWHILNSKRLLWISITVRYAEGPIVSILWY